MSLAQSQYSRASIQQCANAAVRQYSSASVQQCDNAAVRQCQYSSNSHTQSSMPKCEGSGTVDTAARCVRLGDFAGEAAGGAPTGRAALNWLRITGLRSLKIATLSDVGELVPSGGWPGVAGAACDMA